VTARPSAYIVCSGGAGDNHELFCQGTKPRGGAQRVDPVGNSRPPGQWLQRDRAAASAGLRGQQYACDLCQRCCACAEKVLFKP
jgi:hypothetical protein